MMARVRDDTVPPLWLLGLTVSSLVLLFVLIRGCAFQLFNIPSASMEPTLLLGDYIAVAKYPYGISHYSLPFSPNLFSGRILAAEPRRGDVVVFRLPKDDTVDYVKRVVGLPGDRIQMINGALQINGEPVKRERMPDVMYRDGNGGAARAKRWRETLPEGAQYETLDLQDNGFYDNTPVYTVPPGHYFMLGDNRDNSTDSRVLSMVGYVPFENLIGRVEVIYYSIRAGSGTQPPVVRPERMFMAVH
jgi:signal peptidase I